MERLKIGNTEWMDFVDPSESEVEDVIERYDFHELDKEAVLEENQTARVDTYDRYVFVVLHFPKYDTRTKRYLLNEFNIFVSKDYLILFRYYGSKTVQKVFDSYQKNGNDREIVNTGYMLYDLVDAMLDKVFRLLDKLGKDLRILENSLFKGKADEDLIREIMVKKRNIVTLKHMIKPQISALKLLELRMNAMFKDEVEVYFENLEDKVGKIYGEIELLQENIVTMEDTLKTLFDMRTNSTIKYLTFFSAFMLPLTFVTGFFGMNVEKVPFHETMVYVSILATMVVMASITWILAKKGKV
jgi:magnesium transporter